MPITPVTKVLSLASPTMLKITIINNCTYRPYQMVKIFQLVSPVETQCEMHELLKGRETTPILASIGLRIAANEYVSSQVRVLVVRSDTLLI